VITNQRNGGISNSNRIGNTLIGGSFLAKGLLVCQIAPEDKVNMIKRNETSSGLSYIYQDI
jgi:hypothetical protein